MIKIFMILFIFVILLLHIQFVIKMYKKQKKNRNKNILLLDYDFYQISVYVYFIIPLQLFLLLLVTIFCNIKSKDIIHGILIILIFLTLAFLYTLIILKKKVVLEENEFIYSTLFFKKRYEYKGLEIRHPVMGRLYTGPYVYKDNKKILKLHFFLKNTESLEKRIIKANGRECETFAESRK